MNAPISVDLSTHSDYGSGYEFHADGPPVCDEPGFIDGCKNEKELQALTGELWRRALEARRPKIDRMLLQERYYRGLHYQEPWANRELEITNLAFWAVETVWPILTSMMPRPEVMPETPMHDLKAERIQEFADWWQRRGRVQRARRRGTRTKLKFGEAVYLITIDYNTGMPYVIDWLPTDYYDDGSSRMPEESEYHILAAPIATRRLQAMFPHLVSKIVPDNFTSPIYEATHRPLSQMYAGSWISGAINAPSATNPESHAPYLSTPQPTGSSAYVFAPYSGTQHSGFYTTFLLQLIIRDYRMVEAVYPGRLVGPAPSYDPRGMRPQTPHTFRRKVPASPSGWTVVQFTSSGVLLDHSHLDPCFGGLNFVRDFDYEQDTTSEGIGEIENIISMNRAYNDTANDLNRALDFISTPVLVATKGSGIKFDAAGVRPGDVLEPSRGSTLSWLDYRGPGAEHFNRQAQRMSDIQMVTGIHKAEAGEKPAGVEAGVALRELRDAARTRISGKEPGALEAWWSILTKGVRVASKKLNRSIMFKATSGKMMTVDADDLLGEYGIVPAQGSYSVESRTDMEDKILALSDRGLLPPVEVLKRLDIPGWQRLVAQLMSQAPPPGSEEESGGKKPAPAGVA